VLEAVPVSLLRHAEFFGFAGRCAAEHILFEAGRIVVEILHQARLS